MESVAAERRIVLLELYLLLGKFLITGSHVTGRAFAFFTCFSAFNDDGFASHGLGWV